MNLATGRGDVDHGTAVPPRAWRALVPFVRQHRAALVAATVLTLGAAAVGVTLPLVARQLVDGLTARRPVGPSVVGLVALAVANAVLSSLGSYLLGRTGETVVLGVRRALVSHLARLRVDVIDRHEPGDLAARVTADSALLKDATTTSLVGGVTGFVMLVGVVVMMGLMDRVLLAVSAVTLAVTGALVGVTTRRINQAALRAQEATGAVGAVLERMFGAFRTVKASGAEDREVRRMHLAVTNLWRANVRADGWLAVANNLVELAAQAAVLAVLAVGGARVASGAIEVGTLVAFLLYVFMLAPPAAQVVQAVVRLQIAAAGTARIAQVFALPVEPDPSAPAAATRPPDADAPAVVFEDVHFRYGPGQRPVHRGVTFCVPPRGVTAFVGASGEGKTTIFSLIERFHDVESGRVLVEGYDVRRWPLAQLRQAIGYVEQEAPGLAGTLRENLTYAAPYADEAHLWSVLTLVRLDALVARLPQRLETPVGHRGSRLSGGERQRLAIARALLRRPRLLLLDEATSQLDPVNEAALRDTVVDIAGTTTVLVVAHRLSTVVAADRIVVLDAGRVRAIGTHQDLVRTDPMYADLAATQLLCPS